MMYPTELTVLADTKQALPQLRDALDAMEMDAAKISARKEEITK